MESLCCPLCEGGEKFCKEIGCKNQKENEDEKSNSSNECKERSNNHN